MNDEKKWQNFVLAMSKPQKGILVTCRKCKMPKLRHTRCKTCDLFKKHKESQ